MSAGIQTSFRTGHAIGTHQIGYDTTQQYGSDGVCDGMNQQVCASPATAAVPMTGYPVPTGRSR